MHGQRTIKSPVRTKKPKETEFKDKVLSETLERVDSFGSYAQNDGLGEVSKEILDALGRCLGDGVSKVYKPLAISWEGKAKVALEGTIVKLAEAEARQANSN